MAKIERTDLTEANLRLVEKIVEQNSQILAMNQRLLVVLSTPAWIVDPGKLDEEKRDASHR